MRRSFLVSLSLAILVAGAGASAALAQQKTAAKPAPAPAAPATLTAEQVLQKYVEASGGAAAYEKRKTTVMKANLSLAAMGINGTIETWSKAPNKILVVTTIPNVMTQKSVYDGTTGWASDTLNGTRALSGVELAALKREATFAADLRWKEFYKSAEMTGVEKVGDRDAYVVKLTPKDGEGSPSTRYYDAKTFELLRSDSVNEGPTGTVPISTVFSDYREVSGVRVPFRLEATMSMGSMTVQITDVQVDIPVDDAKFAKPQ